MKKLIGILSVIVIFSSCGSKSSSKEDQLKDLLQQQSELNDKIRTLKSELKKSDNSSVSLVSVESFKPMPFKHFVEVQARVDGDESVNVSPRIQGTVTSIQVKEGDHVSKGQILAVLDDQMVRQSLAEVQTQYDFAKNIYDKQKNLWDQKIGSEVQYLTAKNNKESLEKRLASVNEQLDMTRIKSPISGTVDNVNIKVGQAVMPGMQAVTVVNLSALKVKGEVGESYVGKINKGDEVVLYFPDMNKEVKTKVGYAAKVINTLNRTFNVEVPLPGGNTGYSPNMIVVMKIVDYQSEEAMVIPVDLIQKSGDGKYIMVAKKSGNVYQAHRQMVKTGESYNGKSEILEGLSETDQVITVGYRDLNEGEEIKI
ncbi:MAG TPA: efflux RND transporter periplasmic adaptor subunit [Bacteroidia bacterium]|nr:efflux RND transporter periplasmic adaptor subunit [Bacteroidia bacterium]